MLLCALVWFLLAPLGLSVTLATHCALLQDCCFLIVIVRFQWQKEYLGGLMTGGAGNAKEITPKYRSHTRDKGHR